MFQISAHNSKTLSIEIYQMPSVIWKTFKLTNLLPLFTIRMFVANRLEILEKFSVGCLSGGVQIFHGGVGYGLFTY